MSERGVPQPGPERLVPFAGHPLVVGVTPGQPELVLLTACAWASALGVAVYGAYVDPRRSVVEELPDGRVRCAGFDDEGRLGDPRVNYASLPQRVPLP